VRSSDEGASGFPPALLLPIRASLSDRIRSSAPALGASLGKTWGADGSVTLELGYSAYWFQYTGWFADEGETCQTGPQQLFTIGSSFDLRLRRP
jgi:hypothetical protein